MSIRAYKVIRIESKNEPTFNLWHCPDELWKLLPMSEQLNDSGSGYICITREEVNEALERAKEKNTKEILEAILRDIDEDCEGKDKWDDDYVQYSCG